MNSILIFHVDLAFSCILFTNCNLIPLFDLAAIAIAIALKRLCEVCCVKFWCGACLILLNRILVVIGFDLTLMGCILFPALMFALARSHQCFLSVMVATVVIAMMKE